MKLFLVAALCAIAVCVNSSAGLCSRAFADEGDGSPRSPYYDLNYLGNSPSGGMHVDLAYTKVQLGAIYYYRIYGVWPAKWSEVVSAGLVQVPLLGWKMEVIDPDDGEPAFNSDISYIPSADQAKPPQIAELLTRDEPQVRYTTLGVPHTYSQSLGAVSKHFDVSEYEDCLSNDKCLRMFAILGIVKSTLETYRELHGSYPSNWSEFLASGIGPIDEGSINPMTGERFYGDGRANDILYERLAPDSFRLIHVKANGEKPKLEITY